MTRRDYITDIHGEILALGVPFEGGPLNGSAMITREPPEHWRCQIPLDMPDWRPTRDPSPWDVPLVGRYQLQRLANRQTGETFFRYHYLGVE